MLGTFLKRKTPLQRAIVIGGGMAGLLAGRVLADHFDRVAILERDRYPATSELRDGIPQGRHVHLLLTRGRQILERLFPGLSAEMVEQGACRVDTAEELAVLTYYGWSAQHQPGLTLLTFTRPLLDWCVRRRLADWTKVRVFSQCRVTGLEANVHQNTITGVRCRFSQESTKGGGEERVLRAELVVDASGRFSRTPEWLSTLGYDAPEETVVNSFLGYATRLYEQPVPSPSNWKALVLLGKPPDETRGGVLLPVEGERWLVTLAGIGKDYPPTSDPGFLAFARSLRTPILYEAIKDARPLSPIAGFRATKNRLRHYESLARWPDRFIVLGDAVCALNPIYAQGMSVAAMGTMVLDRTLREMNLHNGDVPGFARTFQQKLAKMNSTPWRMAVAEDFRWPLTEGQRPGLLWQCVYRYLDAVIALTTKRPDVDYVFSRVTHLVTHPCALLQPRIAIPALAHLLNPLSILGRWKDD